MTCFWDGILTSLNTIDFNKYHVQKPTSIHRLDQFIKTHNILATRIKWNNKKLSPQELREHYDHVNTIKISSQGYPCGGCDSVLLLLSKLFRINISHNYRNIKFTYTYKKYSKSVIRYKSSSSHFEFDSRV